MYQVLVYHHDKAWRNGDLEDKLELIDSKNFKLKRDARNWMVKEVQRISGNGRFDWHTGNIPSYGYCFTGNTWIHENTGEKMEEYYQYILKKVK